MEKTLVALFKICFVTLLLSGSLLVFGQLAGVVLQNGELIIFSSDTFSKPTFVLSAIAGMIGFVLNYVPRKTPMQSDEQIEKEEIEKYKKTLKASNG